MKDRTGGLDLIYNPGCCKISGKPLQRITVNGLFCDVENCECERKSKEIRESLDLWSTLNRMVIEKI